jgi:hypothetical protein
MPPGSTSIWPRLVIVEGIMGAGKSTTTRNLALRLGASDIPAVGITEGVSPHPIRFDWDQPWSEMRPAQLAGLQLAKWRAFVTDALMQDRISIVDGQLFHGNLTALLLLEADTELMGNYCRDILATVAPLRPLLVYLRQDDIEHAIRVVSAQRGDAWVDYQVNWKLASPYARRRGLAGLDGLVALYRDYRAFTDELFANLAIAKISIDTSQQEWTTYERLIDRALTDPAISQSHT